MSTVQDHHTPGDHASQVIDAARAAEHAIQHLCRTTLSRPSMTPAEVDTVLAHLADAVAALPQTARQLAAILEQATHQQVLEMDALTEAQDPDLAVETARLHLDAIGDPALEVHRHLDAAHSETAHIAVADRTADQPTEQPQYFTPLAHHTENRQPPPMGSDSPGPRPAR